MRFCGVRGRLTDPCGEDDAGDDGHERGVGGESLGPGGDGVGEEGGEEGRVIRDANGNELADGDTVTVIKDLKVKGSSSVVKVGTKVKNIRLVDGDHDIDCKIDGIGAMKLKSEFVKKS